MTILLLIMRNTLRVSYYDESVTGVPSAKFRDDHLPGATPAPLQNGKSTA
jgi:hypothetical protein